MSNTLAPPSVSRKAADSFYRLGPEQVLQAVENLSFDCNGQLLTLNSYENRVYRIGLHDAPPLIAKFYRPNRWSDAAIVEEHDFTLQLSELDIPAIAPLMISGRALHRFCAAKQDEYRFTLYPFRPGRAPDLENPAQLEQLGRFFGRIHAVGSVEPFTHRPTLDAHSFGDNARDYLLDSKLLPAELQQPYSDITADLLDAVEDIWQAVEATDIRLQGDAHPGNILWQAGAQGATGAPYILDFDDARMGPAVQDLWMFLSGEREQMHATLDVLLGAYTRFHDFNTAELRLIEPLRALRIMHHAGWLAKRRDDPVFQDAFPWFNSHRYWEEHILSLKEQMTALHEAPLQWEG